MSRKNGLQLRRTLRNQKFKSRFGQRCKPTFLYSFNVLFTRKFDDILCFVSYACGNVSNEPPPHPFLESLITRSKYMFCWPGVHKYRATEFCTVPHSNFIVLKVCLPYVQSCVWTDQKVPGNSEVHRSRQNFGSGVWNRAFSHFSSALNLGVASKPSESL
jgi:hypothetical protein